jgi:hypothetical protein
VGGVRIGDTRFCLHGGYGEGARYRSGTRSGSEFEVVQFVTEFGAPG